MRTGTTLSWLVVIAGIWTIISPFILGFSSAATPLYNNVIVGIVLVVLGAWAALSHAVTTERTLDWINVIVGIWLLISPFVLAFSAMTNPMWNNVIVGIITIILAAWAALSFRRPTTTGEPMPPQ